MHHRTLKNENKSNHRLFAGVLIVQFIASCGIGYVTDTLMFGLFGSAIIISLPIYLGIMRPNHILSKHAVALGTQLMASLHIQQTLGMTEMHFQVFVMLAFLSVFRDWKVVVTGTLVIATHHIVGFISQHWGGTVVVFEAAQPGFIILFIHASFAILECAVLALIAKRAAQEHTVSIQINSTIQKIMAESGNIDLSDANIPTHPSLQALNQMLHAVKRLAQQSSLVGAGLMRIAEKIKLSSDDLDTTVGEQNLQVSTISESIKNITHSIGEVADLSQNANTIAEKAKHSTLETRTAIDASQNNVAQLKATLETTAIAISELSLKCENISSVMQSIKSVAEQTNLLALNAAIESARAGEHGRGFAVVADEVRNLAIKSKNSAEEIEKITSTLTQSANLSVDNMNNCVNMVELAVGSSESATMNMADVFSSIEKVNDNVTHVANSATEQAAASESISRSTDHLDNMFKSEREQVDHLRHDVSELNQLADELNSQLKHFRFS